MNLGFTNIPPIHLMRTAVFHCCLRNNSKKIKMARHVHAQRAEKEESIILTFCFSTTTKDIQYTKKTLLMWLISCQRHSWYIRLPVFVENILIRTPLYRTVLKTTQGYIRLGHSGIQDEIRFRSCNAETLSGHIATLNALISPNNVPLTFISNEGETSVPLTGSLLETCVED